MALQELSRPPAVTGLGDLGGVLMDASRNYAATKRQDQLLDRRRGEELSDVQSQRAYLDRVRGDERTNRLQDVEVEVKIRARQAMIASLRNEGLLAPGQENDETAIATAYKEFQNRGLEKLYDEMLHTPGPDGQPILSADDILNPAMVAEAKVRLGQLKAQQVQFGLGQRENAQSTVNEIQGQLAQVRQRSAAVAQTIDTPPQQFGPTDRPVLALAAQMAEQNKAGSGRKPEEVAKMAPFAQKQLNEQGLIQHSQKVQAASRELESLRYNEAQLTAALREAMQTFKVAPAAGAGAVLQSPTASTPARGTAGAADVAAALKAMLGGGGATTPPPGAPAPASSALNVLENPTSNPVIAAGNVAAKQFSQAPLQSTLNDAIRERDTIQAQLADVAKGSAGPSLQTTLATDGLFTSGSSGPITSASATAGLLKKQAMADARVRELQAMLQGPAPVMPVASNTPMSSTPSVPFASAGSEWWRTNRPGQ